LLKATNILFKGKEAKFELKKYGSLPSRIFHACAGCFNTKQ